MSAWRSKWSGCRCSLREGSARSTLVGDDSVGDETANGERVSFLWACIWIWIWLVLSGLRFLIEPRMIDLVD